MDLWERLAGLGAMVTSGVEAGEGNPAPARAVVGSALMALRNDLHEFRGWVVEVQGGTEGNPSRWWLTATLGEASVVGRVGRMWQHWTFGRAKKG